MRKDVECVVEPGVTRRSQAFGLRTNSCLLPQPSQFSADSHTPPPPRLWALQAATMAEPVWQETLRLRLVERNAKESSYAPIIEQCAYKFLASDLLNSGFTSFLIFLREC